MIWRGWPRPDGGWTTPSHGVQGILTDFRRAAKPYANTTVVREFDAKYRNLMMSTTSA